MTKYYSKFPRQEFSRRARGFHRALNDAARAIEQTYRAGYTAEPYVQLVEETTTGWRVVAEWMPAQSRWTSAIEAAGFLPHSV